MFVREIKKANGSSTIAIVESVRVENKIMQKVIRTFGTHKDAKEIALVKDAAEKVVVEMKNAINPVLPGFDPAEFHVKKVFIFYPKLQRSLRYGGRSNIEKLKKLEVKNVGVAPSGNDNWEVSEKLVESIRRERAQVEGVIGVLKYSKYKFNKPYARSVRSMETYAQRLILGFNLSKAIYRLQQFVRLCEIQSS